MLIYAAIKSLIVSLKIVTKTVLLRKETILDSREISIQVEKILLTITTN